jgi:hypothetical protein
MSNNNNDWVTLPKYPTIIIGRNGQIKSSFTQKIRKLTMRSGYQSISLNKSSKFVKHLVAEAFIPNPHSFPNVRCKDNNENNCNVNNLEWYPFITNTNCTHVSKMNKCYCFVLRSIPYTRQFENQKMALSFSVLAKPKMKSYVLHGNKQRLINELNRIIKYCIEFNIESESSSETSSNDSSTDSSSSDSSSSDSSSHLPRKKRKINNVKYL